MLSGSGALDPVLMHPVYWYECCGTRFDVALGMRGCANCCGDHMARLRSDAPPISLKFQGVMMKAVFKYELPGAGGRRTFDVPVGTTALCVQLQGSMPVLYCEVPTGKLRQVALAVTAVMTGSAVPEDAGAYVGTALLDGGGFVLHYYAAMPEVSHD